MSQGLPFGFFTQALPVLLRERGLSLGLVGLSSALALPWALKFLWAPLVDRLHLPGLGPRRSWVLTMQVAAAALIGAMAFLQPDRALPLLFVGVLLANLFAATQDIATDGWAVELLTPEERGYGNGVQVAGYRAGMILGGGALLVAYDAVGWGGVFAIMAAVLVALCAPPLLAMESASVHGAPPGLAAWVGWLRRPGAAPWVLVLVTIKAADALGGAMLRPRLVDLGWEVADVGWLLGGVGFGSGLIGALVGGAAVGALPRSAALGGFAALQAVAVAGYAALGAVGVEGVVLLCAAEHLVSGMTTAALFTAMMDHCRPGRAGTDYTVQASVVVLGAGVLASVSGFAAEAAGYEPFFVGAGTLGLGCAAFAAWASTPQPPA